MRTRVCRQRSRPLAHRGWLLPLTAFASVFPAAFLALSVLTVPCVRRVGQWARGIRVARAAPTIMITNQPQATTSAVVEDPVLQEQLTKIEALKVNGEGVPQ